MQQITSFLWFDTQAEEAANAYISIFPNSKIASIARYSDAGPGPKGTVMVVNFELNGQPFAALNGGPQFRFSEAVSFVVHCEDQAEIDKYWSALTAGGQEGPCGWLKDRFGLSWQIVPTAMSKLTTGPHAGRVMQAIQKMKKLDIRTLEDAAAGR